MATVNSIDPNTFDRIARATRFVEQQRTNLAGPRTTPKGAESTLWARITGPTTPDGFITTVYDWVKVNPQPGGDVVKDHNVTGALTAHNVNGGPVPIGQVVTLTFTGMIPTGETDDDGNEIEAPFYHFIHVSPPPHNFPHIHDHRDNYNGGFAFSVYHPGTTVPQMPWQM